MCDHDHNGKNISTQMGVCTKTMRETVDDKSNMILQVSLRVLVYVLKGV